MIKRITIKDLEHMPAAEGFILQKCDSDLDEMVAQINNLLTTKGVLLDGDVLTDVSAFEHDGQTNLLFVTDGVKLDEHKLAIWMIQTAGDYGGYSLRYVDYQIPELYADDADYQDFRFDKWIEELLLRNGVGSLGELIPEIILDEIRDAESSVDNEELWAMGSQGATAATHRLNAANLRDYILYLERFVPETRAAEPAICEEDFENAVPLADKDETEEMGGMALS